MVEAHGGDVGGQLPFHVVEDVHGNREHRPGDDDHGPLGLEHHRREHDQRAVPTAEERWDEQGGISWGVPTLGEGGKTNR